MKILKIKKGEYKILRAGKWIKDPKPSTGKFVKPLPRKGKCLHDFALYYDGKSYRWRCYYCGKFIDEIPDDELDEFGKALKGVEG